MGTYFYYDMLLYDIPYHPPVLHPHHKLQYFEDIGWEEDWIKTARDIVRAEFEHKYIFLEVKDVPTSRKVCVFIQICGLFNF